MDLREIKKLVLLMNENGLCRLEVEEEGKRYLLEKPTQASPALGYAPAPLAFAPPIAPGAPAAAPAPGPAAKRAGDDVKTFNSPMVGTFYSSPSPDNPPFAKAGDRVNPETVLCMIEAMKVFNEIKAEMNGTIVEVLAENQEAVEYNQPLFLIRPA